VEVAGGGVADFEGGGLEEDDVGEDGDEGCDWAVPADEEIGGVVKGNAVAVY